MLTSTAYRFTTAGSLEANPTLLRQRASVALSIAPTGTTFLTRREGEMLAHYLVFPGDMADEPINAAKAVAARCELTDAPDLSASAAVAVLRMPADGVPGSNPQMNAEIAAVVDAASSALRDGEWVACAIRKPSTGEVVAHSKWLSQYGVNTHHSKEANAVILSLWSGADSTGQAESLLQQVAGALPGFDMPRRAGSVTPASTRLAFGGVAVAGAGYALAPQFVEVVLPYPQLGWVATGVGGAGMALSLLDKLPSRQKKIRQKLALGLVPVASRRIVPAAGARPQKMNAEGVITQTARNAAYPLNNEGYLVGAISPLTLVAPHAGAQSGGGTTATRSVPPQLISALGPLFGYGPGGQPVHLTDEGDWRGLVALGEAGSGKSVLLQGVWGYDAARKTGQVSRPTGSFNAQVAFDTKDGRTAAEYIAWSEAAGQPILRTPDDLTAWLAGDKKVAPVVVLSVADQTATLGVELFPGKGDSMNRARRAVNALKYVFGAQSIGPESFATLSRVLVGAFAVTDKIATEAEVETGRSAFFYAGILLGTRGDEKGVRLAEAIRSAGERDGNADALTAAGVLAPVYDPKVTAAARSRLTQAPQNKMEQMLAAEQWWSRPSRPAWASLLEANASIVVDFGAKDGFLMDAEQREQLASLMLYTLHEEIKLHCVGWQERNRLVSIYADELKHIAGTSPEVINWARQDGRSFGVRLVVATQEPEQLEDSVRKTVMGLGTLVAFRQADATVIRAVLDNISVDGTDWEAKDIAQLTKYHAIVRTHDGGTPLTAFTVRLAFVTAMRGEEFLTAQNAIAGVGATTPTWAAPAAADAGISFATFDPDAKDA
ncbi:ATP-binding protein [Microbacterium sp. 77mftsu3.1]|uniref:ATP-binding protein n=1 Tax=Microbacterium sp. 77mftsu3.1 TaxID=1761802 RepID=UPI0003687CB4|nr:ATP-binding protein [Microbacterium sp. 77mftsu3.1]SDH40501.1 hypothetical protein SAMN04488590_3256 [Microbacterium sp. 77mftsu3.1]